jgi:C4-dicarboxylate transporter DctM subunit
MEMSHLIIVLILLGCMATYIPVFMCLFFTSVLGIVFFTDLPVLLLAQSLFRSMDNFALVVVLFFILCGNIMTAGSMVEKLIKVANALVSWLPGGLGMAGVLACGLFGAISGSTVATVVALGGFMIPALIKNGYPEKYTLGLMTTSPNLGVIIPPSIGMILYSMISNVSLEGLFLTGFLPGVLIMLGVCLYSYFFFRKKTEIVRMPVPKPMEVLVVLKDGFWALMLIVIIFGGIFSGAFTANEVAVVACVYAFIVELFIHRSIKFMDVKKITVSSAVTSATLLIIVAGATCFGRLGNPFNHCGRGDLLRPIAYIGRYSGENYRSGFNHGSFSHHVPVGHEHCASFCRNVYGYHFGHHDFRTGILADAGRFWYQLDAFRFDHDGQSGHRILYASHGGQPLYYGFYFQ